MADQQAGAGGQVDHIVGQPLHGELVEVVGGLIQQEHVGLQKHGAGQGQLHAPASGEGAHGSLNGGCCARYTETHVGKHSSDLLHGDSAADNLLVLGDVIQHTHVCLLPDDLALHVHGHEVVGEACQVTPRDGSHEGGLSGTVGAHQAVLAAHLHLEGGLVQQHARAVGQREGGVTQVLLLVLHVHLRHGQSGRALRRDLVAHSLRGGGHDCEQEGHQALRPLLLGAVVSLH
mmetsp:Transcript_33254/g.73279  ORF Transcript_33254/g.73279 Transcript_33254/m.73279 type:complete len:232 (+) Transcript_33254:1752-2447(+)